MTDEELDRARMREACRSHNVDTEAFGGPITAAAKLAREGWTPPDPLEAEAQTLLDNSAAHRGSERRSANWFLVHKALQRGIEIGREQSR